MYSIKRGLIEIFVRKRCAFGVVLRCGETRPPPPININIGENQLFLTTRSGHCSWNTHAHHIISCVFEFIQLCVGTTDVFKQATRRRRVVPKNRITTYSLRLYIHHLCITLLLIIKLTLRFRL